MYKNEIKKVYQLYGFEIQEEKEDYFVFLYSSGYFYNAEIVLINKLTAESEKSLRENYQNMGYSVRVVSVENLTIDCVHEKLFHGFFNMDAAHKRIESNYLKYCEQQKQKLLCSEYNYLPCDYITCDRVNSDSVIDLIYAKLISSDKQLIVLEAAAGYGKTCTSFEVFKKFLSNDRLIPMMTELSHNRKAQIFKYVLLDEIDRSFSAKLSANLVKQEIKAGLVPLIIDGFDELLSKSITNNSDEGESFEEVQNMLDTIADLLNDNSKAKILLTSRKSAMFTGERFDEWTDCHDLGSCITRIELTAPNVKNWLTAEAIDEIKMKGVDDTFLSNPILLSWLRGQKLEELRNQSINQVIKNYFNKVLEREMTRQKLRLSPDEQFAVFSELAGQFGEWNITSEEAEFLAQLIHEIIGEEKIKEYISRYMSSYSSGDEEIIPDEEEFIMKLVHSALLDRKMSRNNNIGFINDFVFGFLLGNAIVEDKIQIEKLDYKYVDLVCTAYQAKAIEKRDLVELHIQEILPSFTINQQLDISNKLFHKLVLNYNGQTITNVSFSKGFVFGNDCSMTNCTFQNCIFQKCIFNENSFDKCSFFNCVFFEPNIITKSTSDKGLIFLGCKGQEIIEANYSIKQPIEYHTAINYERIVLEQFWPIGCPYPKRHRAFSAIRKGMAQKEIPNMNYALESLLKKGIITKLDVCYELNMNKMADIKILLEREV